jgi:alpha-amylase/alpha-mannosidase (GH57 family)
MGIGSHLFWRTSFHGFWPPELGFSMELIPYLVKLGYRYVIVDAEHVEPLEPMRWHEIRYQPHWAEFDGERIIVVARDRELSNAQLSGMDVPWFIREVKARTQHCDFPPLVTTGTPGDEGGWFRNTNSLSNFWTRFYQPLLEARRNEEVEVVPVFIHEYLDEYEPRGKVKVLPGAWNTGPHDGVDFSRWTGTETQKHGLARIAALSEEYARLLERTGGQIPHPSEAQHALGEAYWRLLSAQSSSNFHFGESWVARAHQDLDQTRAWLDTAHRLLKL